MRTVLVTGGAHGDLPSIRACKELGFQVITGGNRPSDPGHKESHGYTPFDYTDANQVARAASEYHAVGIVPSCHDLAAVAASRAAAMLELPGHDKPDITATLHNKHLLRSELRRLNIPTPRGIACETPDTAVAWLHELGAPALIKPPDLAGGRGISRVNSVQELHIGYNVAQQMTRSRHLVLEEFLTGTHHGVTMIIRDQDPVFVFADNEYYGHNPFRVAGASAPSSLGNDELARVVADASKLAGHLKLEDGLLHLQVIAGDDAVSIIEVCRRPPGDFYPRFVELATGFPYTHTFVSSYLGLSPGQQFNAIEPAPTIRHVLTTDRCGVLSGFYIADELRPFIVGMEVWAQTGAPVGDASTWSGGALFVRPPERALETTLQEIGTLSHAVVT